jgi:hypothetical protein
VDAAVQADHKLSEDLQRLLDEHPDEAMTFGQLVDKLGDRGFGFSLLMLALPSALPVPAAGYSTPFGIAIVGLAAQMVLGRSTPWMPEKILNRTLSPGFSRKMLGAAIAFLKRVEHLLKPRLPVMHGRGGLMVAGVLIILMGCLMILPIPGTNTAPAMVIFLVAIGLIEEDGLALAVAWLAGLGAVALYGGIIGVVVYTGSEFEVVFEQVKTFIKGLLGRG